MRHRLSVLVLLAIVAASCSGGAEESVVTSSPDSTQPDAAVTTAETSETTTSEDSADTNQTVSGDDFCDALRQREDEEIDVTDPEEVEATLRAAQETLSSLVDDAPTEIRPAFVEFVEASERAMELYAEYDFDLFAIPVSEIEAAQAAGLEAQNRVVEFCGLDDLDEPTDEGEASSDENVPEELFAPPGLEESSTSGIMTMMSSSARFEDVVHHYAELADEEPRVLSDTPGEREVTMTGDPSSTPPSFIVWVQEDAGRVVVTVSVPESS